MSNYGPNGGPSCIDFGDSTGTTFTGVPPGGRLLWADARNRVLIGGYPFGIPGTGRSAVARLTVGGRLDLDFGRNGILRYGGDVLALTSVPRVFVPVSGGLLAPAIRLGQVGVLRIDTNFAPDPSFGTNGFGGRFVGFRPEHPAISR